MHEVATQGARVPEKKTSKSLKKEKDPLFTSFKTEITGFARIIRYIQSGDELKLISVEEGEFKKGKKHGYCRVIHAEIGACEVGFFHEDKARGKYCAYSLDGSFIKKEGVYKGETCTWALKIANY